MKHFFVKAMSLFLFDGGASGARSVNRTGAKPPFASLTVRVVQ